MKEIDKPNCNLKIHEEVPLVFKVIIIDSVVDGFMVNKETNMAFKKITINVDMTELPIVQKKITICATLTLSMTRIYENNKLILI